MRTRENLTRSAEASRWLPVALPPVVIAMAAPGGTATGERSSGVRAAGVAYAGDEEAAKGGAGEAQRGAGATSVSIGSMARGRGPKAAAYVFR